MPDKIEVERALSERSVASRSSSASWISSTESEDENATRQPDKKIDDLFYFQDAYFEVQDTIFKVHRREFETSSPVFKNIFAKAQGDTAEGRNSDKPIKLDGILAEDFGQLLKVMYRTGPIQVELVNETLVNMDPERSSADRLTVMGWITVLNLTTKLEMGFYRRAAIACLASSSFALHPK